MSLVLLPLVILAMLAVILSGVWVTIALVKAVWRVERPRSSRSAEAVKTADENTP
ncbi:MAG: hypothetical protein ABFE01_17470 [Phycisphaerales bacterium]|jgi:hypothetical protein